MGCAARRDGIRGLRGGTRSESSLNGGTRVVLERGDAFPVCNHGNLRLAEPVTEG